MSLYKGQALGGYQELELPLCEEGGGRGLIKTNSARSAIKLVLRNISPKKVWLPAYICNAVVEAVIDADVNFGFYNLDDCFDIEPELQISQEDCLLVVDYFGLSKESVVRSINRFGHEKTIVDCSHAYFSEPDAALATIYSPRKFFGLPDGGLLYSNDANILQPEERDSTSETRMAHLISRIGNAPEVAYQQYIEAEESISKLPVRGMSRLTERLLQSLDYKRVQTVRSRNALHLHEHLDQYNQLNLTLNEASAPLCYPFLPNVETSSREKLIRQRVFLPSYWPEALNRVEEGSFEWSLINNGLFLPCDQRYNEDDMDRLISLLSIK